MKHLLIAEVLNREQYDENIYLFSATLEEIKSNIKNDIDVKFTCKDINTSCYLMTVLKDGHGYITISNDQELDNKMLNTVITKFRFEKDVIIYKLRYFLTIESNDVYQLPILKEEDNIITRFSLMSYYFSMTPFYIISYILKNTPILNIIYLMLFKFSMLLKKSERYKIFDYSSISTLNTPEKETRYIVDSLYHNSLNTSKPTKFFCVIMMIFLFKELIFQTFNIIKWNSRANSAVFYVFYLFSMAITHKNFKMMNFKIHFYEIIVLPIISLFFLPVMISYNILTYFGANESLIFEVGMNI